MGFCDVVGIASSVSILDGPDISAVYHTQLSPYSPCGICHIVCESAPASTLSVISCNSDEINTPMVLALTSLVVPQGVWFDNTCLIRWVHEVRCQASLSHHFPPELCIIDFKNAKKEWTLYGFITKKW
jgi:hypothetical protein